LLKIIKNKICFPVLRWKKARFRANGETHAKRCRVYLRRKLSRKATDRIRSKLFYKVKRLRKLFRRKKIEGYGFRIFLSQYLRKIWKYFPNEKGLPSHRERDVLNLDIKIDENQYSQEEQYSEDDVFRD
jgi:hypothetical protein